MTFLTNLKKKFLVLLLFLPVFYIVLKGNYLSIKGYTKDIAEAANKVVHSITVGTSTTEYKYVVGENEFVDKASSSQPSVLKITDLKTSESNIFFIESHCVTETMRNSVKELSLGQFLLNPRQCCALESAAIKNPTRSIYVVHTCPLDEDFYLRVPKFAQAPLSRSNVHVVRYNMDEVFIDTPVQDLVQSGRMEQSDYPVEHTADVMRLVFLWKYGGTYLDLDMISLKSLDPLGSNFCGRETVDMYMSNAILSFHPEGHGHDLLTQALQHVNQNFNGFLWTVNGPDVITEMAIRECGSQVDKLAECKNFHVFDHSYFFPVLFPDRDLLFNATAGPDLAAHLKKTAYTVHLWNRYTKILTVQVGSSQTLGLLADEFCHDVYRNCGDEL